MATQLILKFLLLIAMLSGSLSQEDNDLVQCMVTNDCSGSSTLIPRRECCVETEGVAFKPAGQQTCISCVVFGWFQQSFTGQERQAGHTLQVGYMKGVNQAQLNLAFNVLTLLNTASQDDFWLSTESIRVDHMDPQPEQITVIFRPDNVAQEPNESFQLQLQPISPLPLGDNVFFQEFIEMNIQDGDVLEIMFTEDSYTASESDDVIQIRVSKNKRIAFPVSLRVTAMTISEARVFGVTLPTNVPNDDPLSPNRADFADYITAAVNVRFESDERLGQVVNMPASIFIVDDEVNEATRQYFIAVLSLVGSINQTTVSLNKRTVTLCTIIDNDPIRIGFERPNYTFFEPIFTERGFIDQVFLVKENNQLSEQTFQVEITVSDVSPTSNISPATLTTRDPFGRIIDNDYRISGADQRSIILRFDPNREMISFNFVLYPDLLVEGTEAFVVNASPKQNTPAFSSPIFLAQNTFIIIEDNDLSVIGFEQPSYTLREGDGMQHVCVVVVSPQLGAPFQLEVALNVHTINDTADEEDFSSIQGLVLVLNNNNRKSCFEVKIFNDKEIEDDEVFGMVLSFNTTSQSLISLQPNTTYITIVDDDDDYASPTNLLTTPTILPTSSTTQLPMSDNVASDLGQSSIQLPTNRSPTQKPFEVSTTLITSPHPTSTLLSSMNIPNTPLTTSTSSTDRAMTTAYTLEHVAVTVSLTSTTTLQDPHTKISPTTSTYITASQPPNTTAMSTTHSTVGVQPASTTSTPTTTTTTLSTPGEPPAAPTTSIFTIGVISVTALVSLLLLLVLCTVTCIVMVKLLG